MIIDNNLRAIYVLTDNLFGESSKLSSDISSGSVYIDVINANGFDSNKFVYIGDMGADRSELTKINSIQGNRIYCNVLTQTHQNKDKLYLADYNQVNLYKNDTLVTTVTLKADYYTRIDVKIDKDASYVVDYQNNENTYGTATYGFSEYDLESEKRETKYGYEKNLCSIGDIYAYEKPDNLSIKLLSKIDIASREIRDLFITQEEDFTELSTNEVELLRQPCALLTLYYCWTELIKVADDTATNKANRYKDMYNEKIKEIFAVISKQNDNVSIFSQSRMER